MKVMALMKTCRGIAILLAMFIFFAPPIVFSQKLATVCTLFQQKQGEASGPCGHKALSPKANPMEFGMGLTAGPVPENGHFVLTSSPLPNRFVLFPVQSSLPPLRC
jgi:hypothetical protein